MTFSDTFSIDWIGKEVVEIGYGLIGVVPTSFPTGLMYAACHAHPILLNNQ
jgi:hypothetical protein